MASLQWALDYSSQSAEDKTAYVEDLCAVMRKSDLDKAGNTDARGAIFSAFKAQHRKHVTFRNSLIKLYQLFGISIFLDPSLYASKLSGLPAHSATFGSTVSALAADPRIKRLANDPVRRQDNRTLFFRVMTLFGTNAVGAYIHDFLALVPEDFVLEIDH
ncbi:hypothetical protein ARMSODRAFT_1084178 [Armillaria solidipes]|uniref:Uncharacterized protein n=1 Tax=Armillaria solidipes TaxID=1076256 RepID=A0A2H3BMB8_9AGAR|nr:hypothetical protein ARMSODRAFT_1084178 [Armillaria solidipes]